jgi:xanthine dehydrogenase molybdenum-binding subunit
MTQDQTAQGSPNADHSVIGKRQPRVDAGERVTGQAAYAADVFLPGTVHAKYKRSPYAHARILSVETSKALALDGVLAVVTADDFPELPLGASIPMGQAGHDMWAVAQVNMARGKVFWVGQPVAAVAAVDIHTAEKALSLIKVEYEPLDAVPDMKAAMASGAPVLHDHVVTTGQQTRSQTPSNICSRTVIERGDVEVGFSQSDHIVDFFAEIDTAHQGYIEPQAVVAQMDRNGIATIWASSQGQFNTEMMVASVLGMPQSKIKVIPMEVGGAFGGKIFIHGEAVAVRLSEITGRPVKLVLTREELMQGGSGPAAAVLAKITVGADAKGHIQSIQASYHTDAGGLPNMNPTLLMQASAAPYQSPNLFIEGFDVVTNKPRTEAYRAPGGIQAAFALEQAMDELSLKLDLDPLEFRRRNASVTGSPMPIGTPFPSLGLTTILDRVASHSCWTDPLGKGEHSRGRGLAVGYWRGTSMTSACQIAVANDGRPMVTIGAVDISGTRTAMAQVTADQFQMTVDDVYVATGDSKSVGFTDISAGSRIARTMAAAIVEASGKVLNELRLRAAGFLQANPKDLVYSRGIFHDIHGTGAGISVAEIMQATLTQGAIIAQGSSTNLPLGVEVGAHVCDVEVDQETGRITVLRYTAFQDVGRALNPMAVEGQIEGSVAQGLGWAISERFDYADNCCLRNANLLDYRIPTALDVPAIESVIIETPVPDVPYGLRGVGEVPIVPVAACVANAVARATGIRMTHMPMTPERVSRACLSRDSNHNK